VRRFRHLAAVGKHAAGAIVGSALVEVLERGDDPREYLGSLRT
jgi:tryptophan synthase alpha subunit